MEKDRPPAAIEIRRLVKRYGPLEAVKGIDLTIAQGEFFGLLGPNGAGKSTTINAITGLARIDGGRVLVLGHDVVREYRYTRKLIGLSPQEFNLDRYFSIRHVLIFQGGYYGVPRRECERRADELLELFGLADKRDQIFLKLSGGMKRRVMIAKALMHQPPILILDEPTAGIDVELRIQLWRYLRELNKSGITILLTTHYIDEAQELCGRVAIIDGGRIIAQDTPRNLIASHGEGLLTIKVLKPVDWLGELFSTNGDVEVAPGGSCLIIRGVERARVARDVLNLLATHDIDIGEIDVRNSNLEDVFIKLTGRGIFNERDEQPYRVSDLAEEGGPPVH